MKTQFVRGSTIQRCSILFDLSLISSIDNIDDLEITQEQRTFSELHILPKELYGTSTTLYYIFGVIRVSEMIPKTAARVVSARNVDWAKAISSDIEDNINAPALKDFDLRKYTTATPKGVITSMSNMCKDGVERISIHMEQSTMKAVLQYDYVDGATMSFVKRFQKLDKNNRPYLVTNMKLREYFKIS